MQKNFLYGRLLLILYIPLQINERKRLSANGVFTGLMDLLYLVILMVAIVMSSNGQDALPYILFFITALGKLYSNLNSLIGLIDISERFKTSKKQLDEYFKDSKETNIIKDFKEIKMRYLKKK